MNENLKRNLVTGFRKNKLAAAGLAVILMFSLIALIAPLLPMDPNRLSVSERLVSPCLAHPLGTDEMGRDYLAR